jgi:hypothetical protein
MTAPASNVTRQLKYQRNRRGQGQIRKWFWMDAETTAVYDRLIAQWPRQKDQMMAAALNALDDRLSMDYDK